MDQAQKERFSAENAEGDVLLHGFNAVIGQAVFPQNTVMSGLHHFCDNRHCGSAYLRRSDGNVSAFAFKHGN